MLLHIEKLTPRRKADFFDFFDNRAFSDHGEWGGCYCLESHLRSENNIEYRPDGSAVTRDERKSVAGELIDSGVMTGYLVYDGDLPVGWCNAGDKAAYEPIIRNETFSTVEPSPGKIMIIYCMDIAPEYRGRKIADTLMERVIRDAKEEGFDAVEGYPFADTSFAYQYRGPRHLYEKHGFKLFRDAGWVTVMRLELEGHGNT